jgi:4-amino-4-deoxy-L-arabinose transferase-like glycosyltransferase
VINPDAMLVALYTLVLWLGAAILKRGLTFGRAAALCACVGVALVTKATALALLPPALFVIAVSAWPLRRRLALRSLAPAAAAFALLAIPVVAWYVAADANGQSAFFQADVVTSSAPSGGTTTAAGGGVSVASSGAPPSRGFTVNEFGSYLWQFYLPKLPFLHEVKNMIPTISHYPVFQTWLASSWANFGWANVWFPKDVYFGFLLIVVVAVLAAAWPRLRAWRPRRRLPRLGPNATVGAFFAVTGLTLLAGLHWTDFHMYLTHGGPFLQGRYLLPLGALFALVLAAATQAAPRRFRGAAAGAVLAGLIVFQIACLGLIFARYYA